MVWYLPGSCAIRTHYDLYIYPLRSRERKTIQLKSQLGSIEHPIYAHLAVFSFNHPVGHITVPYASDFVEWYRLWIMMKLFLPLGEWFRSLTKRTKFAVRCLLSIPYSISPVYTHGGSGDVILVVMIDGIIYRGLSPVGTLKNHDPRGTDIIIYLVWLIT